MLRWGTYSLIAMCALFLFNIFYGPKMDYQTMEVVGYVGIVVSLIFVYFGIRQYRDKVNGGYISFGRALSTGLLIVLVPAFLFGLFDVVYSTYINPSFYDDYCTKTIERMKLSLTATEFEIKSKQMKAQMEMFRANPFLQFVVMALTVFLVGFIITVVSALILRRDKKKTSIA